MGAKRKCPPHFYETAHLTHKRDPHLTRREPGAGIRLALLRALTRSNPALYIDRAGCASEPITVRCAKSFKPKHPGKQEGANSEDDGKDADAVHVALSLRIEPEFLSSSVSTNIRYSLSSLQAFRKG